MRIWRQLEPGQSASTNSLILFLVVDEATIAFSAKLVDGSGQAFDAAFEALSRDVVKWTTSVQ